MISVVVIGHVDHGKSTLVGRLVYETGNFPDGKMDELRTASRHRGVDMEWSFLVDALQAERDQAVTIETSHVYMKAGGERYAFIDAPGHWKFLGNMLSGASGADAALLVIDAAEGIGEQTRRHCMLLRILGVEQVIAVVNKMDLVGFSQDRYDEIAASLDCVLQALDLNALEIVPVSASRGDNLIAPSPALSWHVGPSLMEALGRLRRNPEFAARPLRLRVQDVYRRHGRRIIVGRLDSGRISVGETISVSATGFAAKVRSIEAWPKTNKRSATAGESIGFTIDKPLFIERGDVITHEAMQPHRADRFAATLFWLADKSPGIDESFTIRFGTSESIVRIDELHRAIDSASLDVVEAMRPPRHAVIEATLRAKADLALDTRAENERTSRFVLLGDRSIVAIGFVSGIEAKTGSKHLYPQAHLVSNSERRTRYGHRGAVIWLTGLPGAGKSTLAMVLERVLFGRGYFTYVLDGDNLRSGLCRDLGFSTEDRTENIRRVGEVAALFADAGAVVITAFISPLRSDREIARRAAGSNFHEIFVDADVATCEARDPKGLYRRARAGEIADFTGVSAAYEPPHQPDLRVDTATRGIDECIGDLLNYVLGVTRNAGDVELASLRND